MRSRAPSLHSAIDDALAGRLQRMHVRGHGLEHIGAGLGALGREIAPCRAPTSMRAAPPAPRTASAAPAAACPSRSRPFGFGQIEPVRRQRLVGRPDRPASSASLARVVVVGDLREAARARRLPPDARARAACPAGSRTASRACRGTAAANAPCRDSGGPRSPPRKADRPASAAPNAAT